MSGHIGPILIGSNTRFRHFCPIRIVAKCPDTLARVQMMQIPELNILSSSELCSVSGHIGPSPSGSNIRFRHFCPMIIVAKCPDTLGRVQLIHIPELNILASSELLFSVRTHWPESNRFKYPIPTCLPDYNCCTVSGHMGPSPIGSNTRFRNFCLIRIVAKCPDTLARVHSVQLPDSDIFA